ncbi:MAG TPA: HAD-IA family hydrolase [Solirubrobacteraceae bacterium]|nr:HAD-IA family hydrolase [Solirubrobacteraceae bacterium]
MEEIHARIGRQFGLDPPTVSALMDEVWAEYVGTANAPLLDYVAGLRPRYRLGVLSNSFVGAREREQAAHGFAERFDILVHSHEIGIGKPDPRAYEIVCDQLGVPTSETVFVDDLAVNVRAAEAAGMTGVLMHDTAAVLARLRELLE